MGLQECQILFDNPYNTYYAGQTVNGKILFTFDSPKTVRGIYVVFKGEGQTNWTEEESRTNNETNETEKETVHLNGTEEYFKTQYYLLGGAGGNGEHVLPVGTQEFPFTCLLPPTLPSSFESTYGYVRYTVKVVIDRPWKFDHETKIAFTVLSPVDLNGNPTNKALQQVTMEKTFCCFCCKSGPLTCVVSIPRKGYVPGETVQILAEIDNASNVEVISMQFVFRKVVAYHSQRPRRETKRETVNLETLAVGPVPPNDSKTWTQPLPLPSLPPSNLTNCSIIDLDYEIYVEAKVSGMHSNLDGKIPLIIGTIPLKESIPEASAPPPQSTEHGQGQGPVPVGWVADPGVLYPMPTYTESEFGANTLRDNDDNDYTKMNNANYRPNYPVFHFNNPQ